LPAGVFGLLGGKAPTLPTDSARGQLRRFLRHRMLFEDDRNYQERRGEKAAHRPHSQAQNASALKTASP
jgi:hypothetical protein